MKGEFMLNREALEQTIRVLEEVIALNLPFDLVDFMSKPDGDWMEGERKIEDAFANPPENKLLIPHNCGCTACATGYAGLDPWFIERGFRTNKDGYVRNELRDGTVITGWEGLKYFYGLSEEEACYLFMPYPYADERDPELVIERIGQVLKSGFPISVYR